MKTKLSQLKAQTPAAGYIAFYPMFQPATDTTITDRSGKGNAGLINSGIVGELWATANCVTAKAVASGTKRISVPKAAWLAWTFNATVRESLLIFMRVQIADPAAVRNWCGNGASGFAGGGINMQLKTGADWGKAVIKFMDRTDASTSAFADVMLGADIATAWHDLAVLVDGPNNLAYSYVDGVPVNSVSITTIDAMDGNSTGETFSIGSPTASAGFDTKIQCVHVLRLPAGLSPINRDALIYRLHKNPTLPLTTKEWGY